MRRFGYVLISILTFGMPGTSFAETPQKVSPDVTYQLRKALNESLYRLGSIEPWQKKVYEDEVLSNSQRFIRDYRPSSKGLTVDVDVEGVKTYLKLYGPSVFARPTPKIGIALDSSPECALCSEAIDVLKKQASEFLANRGFAPILLESEKSSQLDHAYQQIIQKGWQGLLWLSVTKTEGDPDDPAHHDEAQIHVASLLRFYSNVEGRAMNETVQGKLELSDSTRVSEIQKSFSRIWVNQMMEMTPKAVKFANLSGFDRGNEVQLEVNGFKDFNHYLKVRTVLTQAVEDQAELEQRQISRDKVVFAVISTKSITPLLQRAVSGLGKWMPTVDQRKFRLEVKP